MEIDPSPTRPNELEFIELTGINDHALDQELEPEGLRIRALRSKETVLMLLAQQLPAQLEYRFGCTTELEDAAYERLLGLLDEAIQTGKYSKLRRLSMPFASLRYLESTNSLQRDVTKEYSRTRST